MATETSDDSKNNPSWVFRSMVLGIVTGLLFGEATSALSILGEAFIKLLQMTILPYVVVSLMFGFGSLSVVQARRLAINGGLLLLGFWGLGFFLLFMLTLAFPDVRHLTFFSANQVTEGATTDLLEVFIPTNFFGSLANGTVPAVVLFSIIFGLVLMQLNNKGRLLDILEIMQETFENINEQVFKLTPVGIFALTAVAAGTLQVDKLSTLQLFLISAIVGFSLLALLLLPYIISFLLGRHLFEPIMAIRGALILGFTSGNSFVTLPMIQEAVEALFRREGQSESEVDEDLVGPMLENSILVPVVYIIPSAAMVLSLLFIPYTAWLYDRPLDLFQSIQLIFSGLPNLFSEAELALPFLLDVMHLPADAFQQYMVAKVMLDPFLEAAIASAIFAFCVLHVAVSSGRLKLTLQKLLRLSLVPVLAVGVTVLILRGGFSMTMDKTTSERDVLDNMKIADPVTVKVITEKPLDGQPPKRKDQLPATAPLLTTILQRGALRVGYNAGAMPFAFFNNQGDLVGYDIAMAHDLARALGVTLEFVPFHYASIAEDLLAERYDIAMSAVTINVERLKKMNFTDNYQQLHLAFLAPDYQRKLFRSKEALLQNKELKVAVMRGSAFIPILHRYLPNATVVELEDRSRFFTENGLADVMLTTAEQGASWALRYPTMSVVVPDQPIGDDFLGYAVAPNQPEWLLFLNQWLSITRLSSKNQAAYDYWVQGKASEMQKPRWSVMRDVLGWL